MALEICKLFFIDPRECALFHQNMDFVQFLFKLTFWIHAFQNTNTSPAKDIEILMKYNPRTKRWEQKNFWSKTFWQVYENTQCLLYIIHILASHILAKGTNDYCYSRENRHVASIITFYPHDTERHVLLFQFYTWNNWNLEKKITLGPDSERYH